MDIYEQLIRDEGLKLKPYKDTVGKLTIGVGRNLDDVGISISEADYLLRNDVERVVAGLARVFPWPPGLSDTRWSVLVNMAFNLGVHGLLGFRKMLQAVVAGNYALAAQEMMDSQWAVQVGPRAHRLARQMETGDWV